MNRQRRHWLVAGAALAVAGNLPRAAASAQPVPTVPGAASPFETLDLAWHDEARGRPVPARLYLPTSGQPVTLVVFSHGIGGSRLGYTWFGQHMARHGIASLHLQHVGSDRQLWTGNIFTLVGRLQEAARETEAVARARDLGFALDTLLAGPLAPRIDATRIVAAGHSYGANTVLLAAGAQVARDGRLLTLHDPRVKAALVISAPPFYGEPDLGSVLGSVTVPSLHVTCTDDIIRIPGYYSSASDRVAVFEAMGSARKWLAVYQGGSHSMFTDRAGTGGAMNPRAKQATQALAVAFVHAALGGDAQHLADWPAQHREILAHYAAAAA